MNPIRGPWRRKDVPTSSQERPSLSQPSTLDFDDLDTEVTGGIGASQGAEPLVPGLTILGHPDWGRVGDLLPLPTLAAGGSVQLSRLEPVFRNLSSGTARSLEVTHISRSPIRLKGGEGASFVTLDLGSTRTPVVVGGARALAQQSFSLEEVTAGVVLELGYRISLLLHMVPNVEVKADPALGLVGQNHAIARLRQEIRAIAGLDLPVLLRGETGTGKEVVAQALHRESGRKGPFVAVSLAALPPTLAAAELFGASKGAFTGADRKKIGFFQKAQRGTLFLDEIGEAPLEIQVLLLRALESREITPVGSVEALPFDARVVAATDSDLEAAIETNRFRPALLHRLAGYTLKVPPLRERREDIARLFFYFLERDQSQRASRQSPDGRPWPSSALVSRLVGFDWPGNVRQLRNVTSWLAVKGFEGGEQTMRELEGLLSPQSSAETPVPAPGTAPLPSPDPVAEPVSGPIKLHRPPKVISDEELLEALRLNGWKLKPTAQHLNIARTSLYALIDRSETIRRATDLEQEELEQSLERHQGDLAAMAQELRVSPQGLRSRLQELGIGSS